jgi:hypothetical protein
VKSSKAQITAKFHKIPMLRFEDQQLTSFSGLLVFQLFFKRIDLKARLKKCFGHLTTSPIFGRHLIVMLLVIHLLIGFRRLREIDYSVGTDLPGNRPARKTHSLGLVRCHRHQVVENDHSEKVLERKMGTILETETRH